MEWREGGRATYRDDGLVVVAAHVVGEAIVVLCVSHGRATARLHDCRDAEPDGWGGGGGLLESEDGEASDAKSKIWFWFWQFATQGDWP